MNRAGLVFGIVALTAPAPCLAWGAAGHRIGAAMAVVQAVTPLPSIEVTVPKDTAAVEALNDSLSAFSEKVTACIKAGRKPETCRCSYPSNLTELRGRYADLIQQHADWKDQLLSYHRLDKEGRNISGTIVLKNLRRQLEMLKCQ